MIEMLIEKPIHQNISPKIQVIADHLVDGVEEQLLKDGMKKFFLSGIKMPVDRIEAKGDLSLQGCRVADFTGSHSRIRTVFF